MLQLTYALRADEALLSVAQVADLLNVSRLTVYRLIQRRLLPAFRVARRLRFALEDVRRYLAGVRAHDDVLRRKCRRVGLREIGWHVLRHTFASTLATQGASLHTIQKLLGHSSPTMTMRYAHLAPEAFTEAIQLLERSASIPNNPKSGQPVGTAARDPLAFAASDVTTAGCILG